MSISARRNFHPATRLGTACDPLVVEAQVQHSRRMPHHTLDNLVFALARAWLADEVPHEDARIGRARDQHVRVRLQAQHGTLVAGQDFDATASAQVPYANRLVALRS